MPALKLIDIATLEVVTVNDNASINEAVALMNKKNHREVIVTSDSYSYYGLLKANDLIKLRLEHYDFDLPIKSIKYDKVPIADPYCSVENALQEINTDCQCVCLVDTENKLRGFVSYYDILSCLDPKMMLKKRTISEVLLNAKLKTAQQTETALDVISLIDSHVSDSVVIYDDTTAVGIITTKDIIRLFVNNLDLTLPIKEYMSSPLITVRHDISIHDTLDFIKEKHFKRVIVEGYNGEIIGQITQEELVAKIYSRWAEAVQENDMQLKRVNKVLEQRAIKYQELSGIDPLTKVDNRSRLEDNLKKHINDLKRYKSDSFSVIFFDIDNFKSINDTHGHLVGDEVLKQMAHFVQDKLRKADIFARWGGEEFVIILLHTNLENATLTAEKIRESVCESTFANLKITCSFGVSFFDIDNDTDKSVLRRADEAMYKAKNSGKNCVKVL